MSIERNIFVHRDDVKHHIDYVRLTDEIPIIFHFRDYTIPEGATAKAFSLKPSGNVVYQDAVINGNSVEIDVINQMFAEQGLTWLQIVLKNGTKTLITFAYPVNVKPNYTQGDAQESTTVIGLFDQLTEEKKKELEAAAQAELIKFKESLPDDYTELNEKVGQLSEDISYKENAFYYGEDNPLQAIAFTHRVASYQASGRVQSEKYETPFFNVGDLEFFKSVYVEGNLTPFGNMMGAKLLHPLTVEAVKNLMVYIECDLMYNFTITFSSGNDWNSSIQTLVNKKISPNKKNIENLTNADVTNDNGNLLNYVYFRFEEIPSSSFNCFILNSSFLSNILSGEEIIKSLDFYIYNHYGIIPYTIKNVNGNANVNVSLHTYDNVEGGVIPYIILGTKLGRKGKGKKFLFKQNNTNYSNLCVTINPNSWGNAFYISKYCENKNIPYSDSILIDLDELIEMSTNETFVNYSYDYYLLMGNYNNTANREFDFGFSILEVNTIDNDINPLLKLNNGEFLTKEEVENYVESLTQEKYITGWGDSLMAGGGWTTRLGELSKLPFYNGGTGGENSRTIMTRQGADVMIVNNITIPADTTPVLIASRATDGGITTHEGNKVTPLLQGGSSHVNPVKIGDIEGTLIWTGSAYNDTTGTWTFTRSVAGEEVVINRPTAMTTYFDREKNAPHLMVIFMGQNGGYNDLDDLVRQHRLMMEHSSAKHIVILGLSSGTAEQRAEYEARMKKEFGRYFISLREYLAHPIYDESGNIVSCYGLDDCGLTPTQEDLEAIALGKVPPQLLSDTVHYTTILKTAIGNYLYKVCCELGIF